MKIILCALFSVALTAALPYDIIEDETGQQYYAVPIAREKR